MGNAKLTLDDILDLRAYEREREDFRRRIIDLKRVRRVAVGPIITLVFENRDTMRFQIQEMARAERMASDEQIQTELDIYNPLIPERGELTATLFVELGSKPELEEWLPKLVGIERSAELRIGDGGERVVVRAQPDEAHAEQLTREDITASVHYIRFRLDSDQITAFERGPVALAIAHPAYQHEVTLGPETVASLREDLVAAESRH
jgi:hypothetical protein